MQMLIGEHRSVLDGPLYDITIILVLQNT